MYLVQQNYIVIHKTQGSSGFVVVSAVWSVWDDHSLYIKISTQSKHFEFDCPNWLCHSQTKVIKSFISSSIHFTTHQLAWTSHSASAVPNGSSIDHSQLYRNLVQFQRCELTCQFSSEAEMRTASCLATWSFDTMSITHTWIIYENWTHWGDHHLLLKSYSYLCHLYSESTKESIDNKLLHA